jgi:hypothetical protein
MADSILSRGLILGTFIRVARSSGALDAAPFLFLDNSSEIVFGFTLRAVFSGLVVLFNQRKDTLDGSAASHGLIDF